MTSPFFFRFRVAGKRISACRITAFWTLACFIIASSVGCSSQWHTIPVEELKINGEFQPHLQMRLTDQGGESQCMYVKHLDYPFVTGQIEPGKMVTKNIRDFRRVEVRRRSWIRRNWWIFVVVGGLLFVGMIILFYDGARALGGG